MSERAGWVCTAMMRLGTHMAGFFDREMAASGLTQAQFRTLLSLCDQPLSPGELATASMLDRATVSLVAQRMVKEGWLERLPGANRRTHLLTLTRLGRERLEQAFPRAEKLAEDATRAFTVEELEQLGRLLARFESHLRSYP